MPLLLKETFVIFCGSIYVICAPNISHKENDGFSSKENKIENSNEFFASNDQSSHTRSNRANNEIFKNPCQGYDFDDTICEYINNRLLCGYNKNKRFSKKDEIINMGNGCRIRGERLECGYLEKPYLNHRRPPADDSSSEIEQTLPKLRFVNVTPTRTSVLPELKTQIFFKAGKRHTSLSSKQDDTTSQITKPVIKLKYVTRIAALKSTTGTTIEQETEINTENTRQMNVDSKNMSKGSISPKSTSPAYNITTTNFKTTAKSVKLTSIPLVIEETSFVTNFTKAKATSNTLGKTSSTFIPILSRRSKLLGMNVRRAIFKHSRRNPRRYCVDKTDSVVCYDF